ncbi:MAG TPA: DUF72 domain-containing protein [Candidatus Limnocylindrales bacterium]
MAAPPRGRLYAGTSGFAYPDWAPTFYPLDTPADALLAVYARRLAACELNNTYYRTPSRERVAAWAAATPATFRFTIKAQRGTAIRAVLLDPPGAVARLVEPLDALDGRLGSVLFRIPAEIHRDDSRLAALLQTWPPAVPLTLEMQDESWHVDEVYGMLRAAGAAVCATETDAVDEPPRIRLTGSFLYLRLRRTAYSDGEMAAWADRLVPFLEAGHDVFAFFRHDETGVSALRAGELGRLVEERLDGAATGPLRTGPPGELS